jgi:hypothetical protein
MINDCLDPLLADPTRFVDSETVGRALSGNPEQAGPKMVASRARKRGEVLGVWDGINYRYPTFQFGSDGQPLPRLAELIAALPIDAVGSNRGAALWLFAPDAELGGQTPAQVFPEHPDRVLQLRRRRLDTSSAAE